MAAAVVVVVPLVAVAFDHPQLVSRRRRLPLADAAAAAGTVSDRHYDVVVVVGIHLYVGIPCQCQGRRHRKVEAVEAVEAVHGLIIIVITHETGEAGCPFMMRNDDEESFVAKAPRNYLNLLSTHFSMNAAVFASSSSSPSALLSLGDLV